ncbi:MAG: hypothetical protein NTZ67_05660 [Gammaproteobacteria bacterium]|nr:hypothetical protein [Gammaproteobacteria bacterium]
MGSRPPSEHHPYSSIERTETKQQGMMNVLQLIDWRKSEADELVSNSFDDQWVMVEAPLEPLAINYRLLIKLGLASSDAQNVFSNRQKVSWILIALMRNFDDIPDAERENFKFGILGLITLLEKTPSNNILSGTKLRELREQFSVKPCINETTSERVSLISKPKRKNSLNAIIKPIAHVRRFTVRFLRLATYILLAVVKDPEDEHYKTLNTANAFLMCLACILASAQLLEKLYPSILFIYKSNETADEATLSVNEKGIEFIKRDGLQSVLLLFWAIMRAYCAANMDKSTAISCILYPTAFFVKGWDVTHKKSFLERITATAENTRASNSFIAAIKKFSKDTLNYDLKRQALLLGYTLGFLITLVGQHPRCGIYTELVGSAIAALVCTLELMFEFKERDPVVDYNNVTDRSLEVM